MRGQDLSSAWSWSGGAGLGPVLLELKSALLGQGPSPSAGHPEPVLISENEKQAQQEDVAC